MQFKSTLALCAAVLAAVAEGRIAFTTLPSSVKAGSPVNLAWEGADGTPITITLKRGPSNNLQTVDLITGNASGNSYTWTPSTDLEDGSDYALQIIQDDTDINYTGLFTISGGKSSSGSTQSAAASSSAYVSSSANATSSVTAAPSGTAPASAGATGGSISRNTTLSRATLSATSTVATETSEATATEDSTAGATATAAPTNAAVNIASNFGLLLAGFAAVAYLG